MPLPLMLGVEMGHAMLSVEHADHDSKERRNDRHVQFASSWLGPSTLRFSCETVRRRGVYGFHSSTPNWRGKDAFLSHLNFTCRGQRSIRALNHREPRNATIPFFKVGFEGRFELSERDAAG